MLPFVGKLAMWRSGMAGTIPGVACFVLAGALLFGASQLVLGVSPPVLAAALLFALNPNTLYLQSTPMSEPVYLAMVCGLVFFTLRGNAVAAAAVFLWSVDDPL